MSTFDSRDHQFELDLDIIKYEEDSNKVKIVGFLGRNLDVRYDEGVLWLCGNEGDLKLYLTEEDLNGIGSRKS